MFKVGDRVRVVERDPADRTILLDMTGTVMENDSTVPWVAIDGYSGGHNGDTCEARHDIRAIHEWQLELMPTTA